MLQMVGIDVHPLGVFDFWLCLEFLWKDGHGAALGADVGRDSYGFLMRLADGFAEDELGYESSGKRISGTDGVSRSVQA